MPRSAQTCSGDPLAACAGSLTSGSAGLDGTAGGGRLGHRMWSDNGRSWKITALALALVVLCALHGIQGARLPTGWEAAAAEPAAQDGRRLVLSLYRVSRVQPPDRLWLSKVARDVPIRLEDPPEALPALGSTVSVVGTFHADSREIEVHTLRTHPLRVIKQGLGLLVVLLWMASLPFTFTWRRSRLVERG